MALLLAGLIHKGENSPPASGEEGNSSLRVKACRPQETAPQHGLEYAEVIEKANLCGRELFWAPGTVTSAEFSKDGTQATCAAETFVTCLPSWTRSRRGADRILGQNSQDLAAWQYGVW